MQDFVYSVPVLILKYLNWDWNAQSMTKRISYNYANANSEAIAKLDFILCSRVPNSILCTTVIFHCRVVDKTFPIDTVANSQIMWTLDIDLNFLLNCYWLLHTAKAMWQNSGNKADCVWAFLARKGRWWFWKSRGGKYCSNEENI